MEPRNSKPDLSPDWQDQMKAMGVAIRTIRNSWALDQSELAEKAGISCRHLGRIERGETNPTMQILFSLADALGVPAGAFLGNIPEDLLAVVDFKVSEDTEALMDFLWGRKKEVLFYAEGETKENVVAMYRVRSIYGLGYLILKRVRSLSAIVEKSETSMVIWHYKGVDKLNTIDRYVWKGYVQCRVSFPSQQSIAEEVSCIPNTLAVFAITGWRDLLVIWAGNVEQEFYEMVDSIKRVPGVSEVIYGKSYVYEA